ncbi:hypothetical protein [Nonomuraea endophytica]|uniref:Uncharacterized protein n=1 Tax=Nonomuraea endophytica TaxID=714136 RepID=A0A7W8A9X8_9ACTN|nr:hypothetical protein [Nonomuraea endophytica]MBB5081291.1 hypothetical protein [Nonomuraea endophytica]
MKRHALPLDEHNPVVFLVRTDTRIELMTLAAYTAYSREQLAVPVWESERPIARMFRHGSDPIGPFEPVWWNLCDSYGALYAFLVTNHGVHIRFGSTPYQITLREAPAPTP